MWNDLRWALPMIRFFTIRPGETACALHVAQMLEQHRQVTQRLEAIEPLRLRWMQTADAETASELAARYEDLKACLLYTSPSPRDS